MTINEAAVTTNKAPVKAKEKAVTTNKAPVKAMRKLLQPIRKL